MTGAWRPGGGIGTVVLCPRLRIREEGPRLVDAPHAVGRLGSAFVTGLEVRVVSLREPPMSARHLQRCGIAGDAEDGVGIGAAPALHGAPMVWRSAASDERLAPGWRSYLWSQYAYI